MKSSVKLYSLLKFAVLNCFYTKISVKLKLKKFRLTKHCDYSYLPVLCRMVQISKRKIPRLLPEL